MSPSARDELLSAIGGPVYASEMTRGAEGVDLFSFMLDVPKQMGLDVDIAGSIIDGTIERAIDTASTLSVTFHDPRGVLLNSQIWDYTVDAFVDGNFFRLVQSSKNGDDVTLTFEDRIIAWARSHRKPLKISRNKMTRAEFIQMMFKEIEADNRAGHPLDFYCPQLHKKQPIRKMKKEKHRRSKREPGLHKDISLKWQDKELTKEQKSQIERVLDVGLHMDMPDFILMASIMCIGQESTFDPSATNHSKNGAQVGLFQQAASAGWPATRIAEKDAPAFFKAAKAKYRPGVQTLAGLVEAVQGSGQGPLYAKWEPLARKAVKEYKGGKGDPDSGDTSYERTYAKSFQFMRGEPDGPKGENTWQAGQRLAEEVQWRLFVAGNTVFYMTDWDLLKSKPIMVIDEDSEGIIQIDYDHDVGKDSSEATVMCRAERWLAHPGEVVVLKDSMGAAKGRWLVERITRPIFSEDTTITLYTPHHSKREPAPEPNTVTKERRSHKNKKGDGHVSIAPGANRPGVMIHQHVIDFLEIVASHTSEDIRINYGTNHSPTTTSGKPSDHWTGDAADINVGGDAQTSKDAGSKGDNIATAALVALGIRRDIAREWATSGALNFGVASNHQWRGHRVQVGWRTFVGGNHFNHVHIGVN